MCPHFHHDKNIGNSALKNIERQPVDILSACECKVHEYMTNIQVGTGRYTLLESSIIQVCITLISSHSNSPQLVCEEVNYSLLKTKESEKASKECSQALTTNVAPIKH